MKNIKIAFFDTKPYDCVWFDRLCPASFEITYFEHKLSRATVDSTKGYDVVVPFVNDCIDRKTIEAMVQQKVKLIAMRCSGYNNVDIRAAYGNIPMVRVPGYSPHAVAEHAMALLLCLNRKIHRAFIRTRDYNFSLNGMTGWDLYKRTAGIIGTGKIGQCFIEICRGFGMKVIAYDPYPVEGRGISYVSLEELFEKSDVISLHCPLTEQTNRLINKDSIRRMKTGVTLINTSRGALIDSEALLEALQEKKIGSAGLDVYEEESDLFFEDYSNEIVIDPVLTSLVALPNVILTSHQAFLTQEALQNIAQTTLSNIENFFEKQILQNEIVPS